MSEEDWDEFPIYGNPVIPFVPPGQIFVSELNEKQAGGKGPLLDDDVPKKRDVKKWLKRCNPKKILKKILLELLSQSLLIALGLTLDELLARYFAEYVGIEVADIDCNTIANAIAQMYADALRDLNMQLVHTIRELSTLNRLCSEGHLNQEECDRQRRALEGRKKSIEEQIANFKKERDEVLYRIAYVCTYDSWWWWDMITDIF